MNSRATAVAMRGLLVVLTALSAALIAKPADAFHASGTWYYQNVANSTSSGTSTHSQAELFVNVSQPAVTGVDTFRWLGSEFGSSSTFIQVGTKKNYGDATLDFFVYSEDTSHTKSCLNGSSSGWGGKGCYINVSSLGVSSNSWCWIDIRMPPLWASSDTIDAGVSCGGSYYVIMRMANVTNNAYLTKPGYLVMEAAGDYSGTSPSFTSWRSSANSNTDIASMFVLDGDYLDSGQSRQDLGLFRDESWYHEYGSSVTHSPPDCSGTGWVGKQGTPYDTNGDASVFWGSCYTYLDTIP